MTYLLNEPWLLGLLVAIALAATIEVGRRIAAYIHIHDDPNRKEQMVAIRDGLFVLVSLLLGFTLALSVPRYNERRTLLVEEAISIETTYLRAAMLPQPYRDNARDLLDTTSMPASISTTPALTRSASTRRRIVPNRFRLSFGQTQLPLPKQTAQSSWPATSTH
jgi:hypothetical protein